MTDFALSRRVAGRLDVVAATGSTNADLARQASDAVGHPHLSVLVTRDQTAGRGRLDRTWQAPAGASLAISVLLRRLPASYESRGWIPLIAGAAMADAVAAQLPEHRVVVKWPNDVLVDGAKICGILAEASGDAVVVGAGVNTAMTAEQLPVSTATSFACRGAEADEDRLLADYLGGLSSMLDALVGGDDAVTTGLHEKVVAHCVTIGQQVRVMLPGERTLEGTATGLDAEGRLIVAAADAVHIVSAGDVVHLRPAGA